MTQYPHGAACVVDAEGRLMGILTDGDIRRILSEEGDILNFKAVDWMTQSPVSTRLGVSLGDAVRVMEDRSSQISVLPVVAESGGKLLGLLRLHDVYQPNFS